MTNLAINMAMTLDGKVARPDGKWYGLSTQTDKEQMDTYRSQSDALIVGKNSIINDNPVIKIRYIENAINPRPVVLVRRGTIPRTAKIFEDSDHIPLIICTKQNKKEIQKELENLADIHALDSDDIDPKRVIGILSRQGYENILLEGGPKLNYSFLKHNLVNKIHITVVPFIMGSRNLPSFVDGEDVLPDFDSTEWTLKASEVRGNEIYLTYELQ